MSVFLRSFFYGSILLCFSVLLMVSCSGLIPVYVPPASEVNEDTEWIMLGGNLRHHHAASNNIAPPLDIMWRKNVKSVVPDHPLAVGDFIFAPTRSGLLYLIDYETGTGVGNGKLGPSIAHIPTIYDRVMYAGLTLGEKTLIGFDLQNASKIYTESYPYISTSPQIWNEKIYFGTRRNLFFCVSLNTGKEIWKYPTRASVQSSPALNEPYVVFGDDKGWLYSLDVSSGILLWETRLEGTIYAHPVLDDSTVYIGTVSGKMYAVNLGSGKIRWNRDSDGAIYGGVALYDDILYFGNNAHEAIALNKNTGEQIWSYKTEGIVNTVPLPSPDYLYVASWDQNLYVFERQSGKMVFKYQFDRPLKSSPIIYRDYLLVHTANEQLIALANEKLIQARRDSR